MNRYEVITYALALILVSLPWFVGVVTLAKWALGI